LKIWDAASGECLLTFASHSSVSGCAWSPDGRRVIACFDDGSVSTFDAVTLAETGPRCHHMWPPHRQPTWASVDPVHNRLLGYGEDAWRSVGYVVPDETGMPMWLPIEAFADDGEE
jgi:WD40 repeat protein